MYVAFGDVTKDVPLIRQVWRFLIPAATTPCVRVCDDNEGTNPLANNLISNSNSKYIDLRHRFLRELVERQEIEDRRSD